MRLGLVGHKKKIGTGDICVFDRADQCMPECCCCRFCNISKFICITHIQNIIINMVVGFSVSFQGLGNFPCCLNKVKVNPHHGTKDVKMRVNLMP